VGVGGKGGKNGGIFDALLNNGEKSYRDLSLHENSLANFDRD